MTLLQCACAGRALFEKCQEPPREGTRPTRNGREFLSCCRPRVLTAQISRQSLMNPPSNGRRFAFWILIGVLSVVFVEVPAGSTMFPFWTAWGLLVVLPLYLLHSVFLAGLVFRFGRPGFWPLFAAGMLYGMYEGYITKVLWTSFRPEGPFLTVTGVAFFETILLVFFLHPLLAFVVPLLFTELLCTRSSEIVQGFPSRVQRAIRNHPARCIGGLMAFLGFMQFINSPSVAKSLLSGAGNSLVVGLALLWWRRSGGAVYSLRELLPGARGIKIFGLILFSWYVFWGIVIKPKSIPGVLHGQLTVWVLYAILLLIFIGSLRRSRQEETAPFGPFDGQPLAFSWRGFVLACAVATFVTTLCRLLLFRFALIQVVFLFAFYVAAGLLLFAGSIRYSLGPLGKAGSPHRDA